MNPNPFRQRGVTLLVSLIMLVLMTLLAVSVFNIGKSSLGIVGNFQQRKQASASAQEAVSDVISSAKFVETPTAMLSNNSNSMTVDVNGDGTADVTVNVTRSDCLRKQPFPSSQTVWKSWFDKLAELQAIDAPSDEVKAEMQEIKDNMTCQKSRDAGDATLCDGKPCPFANDTVCSEGLWEIQAVATDNVTSATYSVTQGVGVVRSDKKLSATGACP